jgi:hypothetical protein
LEEGTQEKHFPVATRVHYGVHCNYQALTKSADEQWKEEATGIVAPSSCLSEKRVGFLNSGSRFCVLPVDEIVTFHGPISLFPVNRAF